jgi:hypothetical protein
LPFTMAFVTPYCFRAEMSKPALMDFIARTPMEAYCLLPEGSWVYGLVISNEVLEYLTNEFAVRTLEIIPAGEFQRLASRPQCRIWGSRELLALY